MSLWVLGRRDSGAVCPHQPARRALAREFNYRGEQESAYSAGLSLCWCRALLFRAALRGWLVLFLPATGGSVILFCTSTNHQEQY